MDIEHLSKSQIILLTLLISFVTSIATGIVTVSLMDQAPPVIAQTVNRVIEHTIETVAASSTPAKSQPAAVSTVVTQEKTVIVNDSDLITQAVAAVEPSIVHIYTTSEDDPTFLAVGVVIDAAGTIVTDSEPLQGRSDALIALPDGTRVRAFVVSSDSDNGSSFLQVATSTLTKPIVWTPATIVTDQAVLGESLVAISGKTATRIMPGVVTALTPVGGGHIIDTNIPAEALLPGSPIVNTEGSVVGVSTSASRASSEQGFVPASVFLPAAPAPQK